MKEARPHAMVVKITKCRGCDGEHAEVIVRRYTPERTSAGALVNASDQDEAGRPYDAVFACPLTGTEIKVVVGYVPEDDCPSPFDLTARLKAAVKTAKLLGLGDPSADPAVTAMQVGALITILERKGIIESDAEFSYYQHWITTQTVEEQVAQSAAARRSASVRPS